MKQLLKNTLSLGLSALLMLGFLPPTEAKAASNQDDRRIIVAMGDSYSSGEGIEPFFHQHDPLTDKVKENDWLAHRSEKAWSGMLELPDANGQTIKMWDSEHPERHWDGTNDDTACWYFVAASGAETWNICGGEDKKGNYDKVHQDGVQEKHYVKYDDSFSSGHTDLPEVGTKYLRPQIEVFDSIEGASVDYVVLTLGGNDAGFVEIMKEAVIGCTFIDKNHLTNMITDSAKYIVSDRYKSKSGKETDGLLVKLKSVYERIANTTGEDTTIIVAGYPQLVISDWTDFNPWRVDGTINVYGLKYNLFSIDKDECATLNWAVNFFNDRIEQLVKCCREEKGMNIHFVSVAGEDGFLHHEPGTETPYLHSVKLPQQEDLDDRAPLSAYSFHPNEEGAKAYARCVQAKIDELEGIERDPTTGEMISVKPPAQLTEETAGEPSSHHFFDSVDESDRQKMLLLKETTYRTDTEDSIEPDCQYTLFALNSQNERVALEEICFNADLHIETSYQYDNYGHLIYDYTNSNAGAHWHNEYLYSGDNLARKNLFSNDELLMYTEYDYDETNRLKKELRYDWDGHLDECVQYSYDDLDRLSESFSEHNLDSESWYYVWNYYYYDQYNRVSEIQRLEHPPDYYQRAVYEYDSNGNIERESIFSEDGKLVEYTLYEYGDVLDYLDEIARLCSSMPMESGCICRLPLFSNMLAGQAVEAPKTEKELLASIKSASGLEQLDYLFIDMDHDGKKELVELCVAPDSKCQIWFCSYDGAKTSQIYEYPCYGENSLSTLEVGQETHVVINAYNYLGAALSSFILRLKDEMPSLIQAPGGIVDLAANIQMNSDGDITLGVENYDGVYDSALGMYIVHTYEETYLFYDGKTYKEYGIKQIPESQFMKYQNSDAVSRAVTSDLSAIEMEKIEKTYFIRENGILHIQCSIFEPSGDISFFYYTYRLTDKVVLTQIGERKPGQISNAVSVFEKVYPSV